MHTVAESPHPMSSIMSSKNTVQEDPFLGPVKFYSLHFSSSIQTGFNLREIVPEMSQNKLDHLFINFKAVPQVNITRNLPKVDSLKSPLVYLINIRFSVYIFIHHYSVTAFTCNSLSTEKIKKFSCDFRRLRMH